MLYSFTTYSFSKVVEKESCRRIGMCQLFESVNCHLKMLAVPNGNGRKRQRTYADTFSATIREATALNLGMCITCCEYDQLKI